MQDLIYSIGALFSSMFEGAPEVMGSKYPVFFLELLVFIIIFDVIIFGWRPLVRKFFPEQYSRIDYLFNQIVNGIAFLALVLLTFFFGGQLGDTWGTFLGISVVVWLTLGIVAVIFLGRFVATRSFSGTSPRTPVKE